MLQLLQEGQAGFEVHPIATGKVQGGEAVEGGRDGLPPLQDPRQAQAPQDGKVAEVVEAVAAVVPHLQFPLNQESFERAQVDFQGQEAVTQWQQM